MTSVACRLLGRALVAPLILSLATGGPAAAADKTVAQLRATVGQASIERQASVRSRAGKLTPIVAGAKAVKVEAGDVIRTAAGSAASLVLRDGSEVRLGGDTVVALGEADVSALVLSGRRERPIQRIVGILAGSVQADIVPNSAIETLFWTPSGIGRVTGTGVGFEVDDDDDDMSGGALAVLLRAIGGAVAGDPYAFIHTNDLNFGGDITVVNPCPPKCRPTGTSAQTSSGQQKFENPATGLVATLDAGFTLNSRQKTDGTWEFEAPTTNPGPLAVTLPNGQVIKLQPGTRLEASIVGKAVHLKVVQGGVDAGDGRLLGPGDALAYAYPGWGTGGATSTIQTTEGVMEVETAGGVKLKLKPGVGVTLHNEPDGSVVVGALAGNQGDVEFSYGDETGSLPPGAKVDLTPTSDGIEVHVLAGEFETPDGTYGPGRRIAFDAPGGVEFPETLPASAVCGNGVVDPGEACDDGNGDDLDGCDSSCRRRPTGKTPCAGYPEPCGECGVADGQGCCTDNDAMCELPCYRDRHCSRGTCTPGTRLTSKEDPKCN